MTLIIIVSIHKDVLPVCLSPKTSSRWPLPIGTRLSTILYPVYKGSFTLERVITPGALIQQNDIH